MGAALVWVDASGALLGPATSLQQGYYADPEGRMWRVDRNTGEAHVETLSTLHYSGSGCTGTPYVEGVLVGQPLEVQGVIYDLPVDLPLIEPAFGSYYWYSDGSCHEVSPGDFAQQYCPVSVCYALSDVEAQDVLLLPGPFPRPLRAQWL